MSLGTHSLLANAHFIQKLYCARELFPLTTVLTHSILLFNSLIVIIPFTLYYRGGIGWSILILPAVIAIQLIFALGLSLISSCLQVFYRDVSHLVDFFLSFW
ncbi:MAG: hypothetical protein ACE5GQ_10650, partial [Nitrospinales bacterium]